MTDSGYQDKLTAVTLISGVASLLGYSVFGGFSADLIAAVAAG